MHASPDVHGGDSNFMFSIPARGMLYYGRKKPLDISRRRNIIKKMTGPRREFDE
jgi:hypothetical protein